jgi:stress-induced morphogen
MPMDPQEIARLIKARFPDAQVTLKDLAGDGDHFAAHVVAKEFAGKTRVQQHKMVYEALEGRMGGVLHALALTTTPPKD